ncbi:MAG: NAD(P)/FAD-dependent oxidoreductase [Candidatus Cloacimonetes bacterium]|nr:NAD(P)/FAD-dependent oxidoreductase [Candidatus Cloacimonadota bacterium]
MEEVKILIIGAGCVGLAVGLELSRRFEDVLIVEKEDSYGRHTSSRNSEVIHSGIYYPQNSLKTELCIQGRELMYEYLQDKNIPHRRCGKLVIATEDAEIPALLALRDNGIKNGVTGLEIIDKQACRELAPEVIAEKALLVPCTGILDSHRFMQQMKIDFEAEGGFILFDMEVMAIEKTASGFIVTFNDGEKFLTEYLINCAGLQCEEIARFAGINTTAAGLNIHWCKAEYFKTTETFGFDKLIYPLPDPTGMYLGIHLTLNLAGEVRFGPSAYYVNKLEYGMDERDKQKFIDSVSQYLRFQPGKLHPDDTGIRPKLQGEGEGFRDFYIKEESEKGLPRFINLMGIESPGLTASLAIGKYVLSLLGIK